MYLDDDKLHKVKMRSLRSSWRMKKNQAKFRREEWNLSFDEYVQIWGDQWIEHGREKNDIQMARIDPEQPWQPGNVDLVDQSVIAKRKHDARS